MTGGEREREKSFLFFSFIIFIVQMTQITNVEVIGLIVDLLWQLSFEFYDEWQKVATHHRTQNLNAKV